MILLKLCKLNNRKDFNIVSTGEELTRPVALYLDNDVREVAIEGLCKMLFATKLREEISDAR